MDDTITSNGSGEPRKPEVSVSLYNIDTSEQRHNSHTTLIICVGCPNQFSVTLKHHRH